MVAGRSWLLIGIAALAALLVPAVSAGKPVQKAAPVDLALLPLQKAQLGAAGSTLSLAGDSGAVASASSMSLTEDLGFTYHWKQFQKLGRVRGYTLDYGDPFSGCTCITQIRTYVERYATAAGAQKGLAFWKKDEVEVARINGLGGLAVHSHRFLKVPPVGTSRYAYLATLSTARARPVQVVDERFADGRYVLEVQISSGTGAGARTLVSKLAKKLDDRLHLALAGRLDATPAKIPPGVEPGPPSGGPDLSPLVLQQSDLGSGPVSVDFQGYLWDPFARSRYGIEYIFAGRYGVLGQAIEWYPSADEAAFRAAYDEALATASQLAITPRADNMIATVNLDSIGQGDRATTLWVSGGSGSYAYIALSRGHAEDLVIVHRDEAHPPVSDVQTLAQAMADRLDAGVSG